MRLEFSAAAVLFSATAVLADGIGVSPHSGPGVGTEHGESWMGFYGGAQFDYHTVLDESQTGFGFVSEYEGSLVGLFAGYRYDFGTFVVGAEIDHMVGELDRGRVAPGVIVAPGSDNPQVTLLRVGGEVGYDLGDLLVYGTAGFANIDVDFGGTFIVIDGNGVFYGLGLDYRVTDNVLVGVELLQHDFSDFAASPITTYDLMTVGMNVAFTF